MDHKERRHYRQLRQQVKTVEDMSLKRAMQDWNMKYVDIARSPVEVNDKSVHEH